MISFLVVAVLVVRGLPFDRPGIGISNARLISAGIPCYGLPHSKDHPTALGDGALVHVYILPNGFSLNRNIQAAAGAGPMKIDVDWLIPGGLTPMTLGAAALISLEFEIWRWRASSKLFFLQVATNSGRRPGFGENTTFVDDSDRVGA